MNCFGSQKACSSRRARAVSLRAPHTWTNEAVYASPRQKSLVIPDNQTACLVGECNVIDVLGGLKKSLADGSQARGRKQIEGVRTLTLSYIASNYHHIRAINIRSLNSKLLDAHKTGRWTRWRHFDTLNLLYLTGVCRTIDKHTSTTQRRGHSVQPCRGCVRMVGTPMAMETATAIAMTWIRVVGIPVQTDEVNRGDLVVMAASEVQVRLQE